MKKIIIFFSILSGIILLSSCPTGPPVYHTLTVDLTFSGTYVGQVVGIVYDIDGTTAKTVEKLIDNSGSSTMIMSFEVPHGTDTRLAIYRDEDSNGMVSSGDIVWGSDADALGVINFGSLMTADFTYEIDPWEDEFNGGQIVTHN